MSTNIWVSTTGNWANTAGWHNSDIPDSADSALLVDNDAVAVTSGFAQGAIDLDKLLINDFPNAIGAAGTPLVIGATTFQITGNTGAIYIENSSGSTNTWYIASTSRQPIVLTGTAAYTRVVIISGVVSISDNVSVGIIEIGYNTNENKDAVLTLDTCVVNQIEQSGGTIYSDSTEIVEHYKSGGEFYATGTHVGSSETMWHSGGKYDRRINADFASMVLAGGFTDLSHNVAPWDLNSITLFPGAKFLTNPNVVTITNTYNIEKQLAYGPQP